ncbi:hypothetical protein IWQ62_004692 [Dispira parvispora]|uniref:BSD domain-containing protein n=1 Tax=Dispira parvispora TaxID=1520584 RepID=A0A9W8APA7_9FUNG|nr:hypothetical protein IWQ62_004692 [Dispira parvispora]
MSTSNAAENGNTLADGKKTDSTDKGKSEHSSANPSSPDNPSVPADKSITAVPESSSAVSPDQPTTEATVTTAAGQKDDLFQHLLTPSADWYTKDITDFQGSVHWDQLVKEVRKQADKLPHYSKEDLQKLAQTVSKDAGQGMGLVMRGLDQIKNGLQSQGDKLEQLLQTASLGPGDNPEPTESSSKSKAEEVIETPSVTGQSANQRSGDAANVFPTLPSAASLASAQQTVRGWWGGFTKQTLPTQVEKSEVTMNRWGIGITNFIQQAFTIEAPEGNPTGTSSSTARSSGNMGSSPGSAQSTLQQRRHDRLTKLQSDKQTYLVDPLVDDKGKAPAQVAEEFAQFASEYSWAAYEPEAQALLADHQSPVYAMHQMLVPMQADNDTFWLRYFFRKYQLEEQERVRERLISGAGAGEVAQSIASRNSMTTSSLTTPIVSPRTSLGTRPTSTAHAARDSQQEGTPETSHDVGNKHPVDSLAPGPVPTSDNSSKAKDDEGDVGWGTDDEVGLEDNIKGLSVTSPTTSPSALEIPPSGVTLPSSPSLESVPSPSNASSVPSPSKVTDTTVQGKKGGSPSSTLNTTTPTTQSKTNNAQPPQGSEDDDDWGDWE